MRSTVSGLRNKYKNAHGGVTRSQCRDGLQVRCFALDQFVSELQAMQLECNSWSLGACSLCSCRAQGLQHGLHGQLYVLGTLVML